MTNFLSYYENLTNRQKKTLKIVLNLILILSMSLIIINSYKSHLLDFKRLSVAKSQYQQTKAFLSNINTSRTSSKNLNESLNKFKENKDIIDIFWESQGNGTRVLFKAKKLNVADNALREIQEKSSYVLSTVKININKSRYPYDIEAQLTLK